MNIVIFDNSKGKCFKKTRRYFSNLLIQITPRQYIGNLPKRIILQLTKGIKKRISSKSSILLLVAEKDGFHGWSGYYFGDPLLKSKYENLILSNRYITN